MIDVVICSVDFYRPDEHYHAGYYGRAYEYKFDCVEPIRQHMAEIGYSYAIIQFMDGSFLFIYPDFVVTHYQFNI